MKIKQIFLAVALLLGLGLIFVSPLASAATCGGQELKPGQSCCGGVVTSVISCNQTGGDSIENTGVWGILLLVINILTAGIGIAAVGGVIYGSIMYASAGDDPGQVKTARTIITNVVVGLAAYALMYSFLNFIIPGGLFTQ